MTYENRDELIDGFNEILKNNNSILMLKNAKDDDSVEITLLNDPLINEEQRRVFPNKDFYKLLNGYFERKSIKIQFNNSMTVFWLI